MPTCLTDYRELLAGMLGGDTAVADMLFLEAGRTEGLSATGRHPFLFHGLLAALTNVLYPLAGLQRKVCLDDGDFVFVSCPDPVFRTRTISLIAGELKYGIVYLPNFHVLAAFRYHQFFKQEGIRAFFPTVRLRHVWEARRKAAAFRRQCGADEAARKLYSALSSYLIYDGVVRDYLSQMGSFRGKWILEHDKFYFMPSVVNLHDRGLSCTMLQHGVFFRVSSNYFPLYCDTVLCCSEREKRIYLENDVTEDRVVVLGAPLQTLQLTEGNYADTTKYDLLVMMTQINNQNIDLIREVLGFIKGHYHSVLVRMRPRSRTEDETLIGDALKGLPINEPGSPIMEDIACCKKVVSFSEDAILEVVKLHKPFIYVWTEGERSLTSMGSCATKENYKEEIDKLMTQAFYSTFDEDHYREVLGETDVAVLREKFERYIKS